MQITLLAEAKEIAALVLALQERQQGITNQLVLDTVNNAPLVQNSIARDTGYTSNDSIDIEDSCAND